MGKGTVEKQDLNPRFWCRADLQTSHFTALKRHTASLLKINTELILAVWAEGRRQPCFSPSAHLRILSCQLRPRHTPATHGALVTPDRYRCYLPVLQCNRGCLATPPQHPPHPPTPHPLFSSLSPVKSPRGPDHSKANMWFELASQKPALHTWGCVRNPRARWSGSACVVCNCERRANCVCVCDSFYKYMPGFVSLKRKYYFACGCILTQEVSMLCLWGLNKTKN